MCDLTTSTSCSHKPDGTNQMAQTHHKGNIMKLVTITLSTLLALNVAALAEGDIKKGKKVFKKCAACHTVKEGKHKLGPSLFGIFGRTAGSVEGVKYSDAMIASGIVWDEDNMREFLTKPKGYIKGTSMAFGGIKKEKQLDDLIAYMEDKTTAE